MPTPDISSICIAELIQRGSQCPSVDQAQGAHPLQGRVIFKIGFILYFNSGEPDCVEASVPPLQQRLPATIFLGR